MKDLPFTWKDYLLEQLGEEHVRTKLTELQEAFAKEDKEPEYWLSHIVFRGEDGGARYTVCWCVVCWNDVSY